jgi:hypothetical protein
MRIIYNQKMKSIVALSLLLCFCSLVGCNSGPSDEDMAYVAAFTRAAEEVQKSRKSPDTFFVDKLIEQRLASLAIVKRQYQQVPVPGRFTKTDSLLMAAIAEQESAFAIFQAQIKNYTEENRVRGKEHWKKAYDLLEKSVQAAREASAVEVQSAMKKQTP